MMRQFTGGMMLLYLFAGAYVWWLAPRLKRRWLALVLFMLLWPLMLIDVEIDCRKNRR